MVEMGGELLMMRPFFTSVRASQGAHEREQKAVKRLPVSYLAKAGLLKVTAKKILTRWRDEWFVAVSRLKASDMAADWYGRGLCV